METIILRSQNDTFVKSYDAKTGELVETRNVNEAKEYKTRAGAESSSRSIFQKCYLDNKVTENIYFSTIVK